MKIVMLSRHGCIRVMKESAALIRAGHEVHLVVEQITQMANQFETICAYQDPDQLYAAVRLHMRDADIFHAHNEPSWFVTVCKDLGVKQPVVLDMHDSNLLRKTKAEQDAEREHNEQAMRISIDERNNAQLADALVYPCEPMRDIAGREFGLEQPHLVLPSYVPRALYRIDFQQWLGGLVYEGRIDLSDELPGKWQALFQYSNYLELAEKLRTATVPFHIYTPRQNEKVRERYGAVSILHQPVPLQKLIKQMGSHEWGLVGNLRPHTEWKNALPNKLFEYLAACLPVVAMHADESARMIEAYGLGIVVGSVEELCERWDEHRACRGNVIKHRREFEMENHIGGLEQLYRGLLS